MDGDFEQSHSCSETKISTIKDDNEEAKNDVEKEKVPEQDQRDKKCGIFSPNRMLTPSERKRKNYLKRQLKARQRINKLEQRIRHSQRRKDPLVEKKTRTELKNYLEELRAQEEQLKSSGYFAANTALSCALLERGERELGNVGYLGIDVESVDVVNKTQIKHCKDFIISGLNQVISHNAGTERKLNSKNLKTTKDQNILGNANNDEDLRPDKDLNNTKAGKSILADEARYLLRHMHKGTQSRDMFRNTAALWGYTRQKFLERAMLVVTSLQNVEKAINLNEIKSVCSIGCGPGCDAYGIMSFLRTFNEKSNCMLQELVLLDYAMEDWKQILFHTVEAALQQGGISHGCRVTMESCDVTQPLISEQSGEHNPNVNCTLTRTTKVCDIFLISYLLSETRGQWETFLLQLINIAKPGSYFYFAEPSPWQLHRVVSLLQDDSTMKVTTATANVAAQQMDFMWLDSSMKVPELQCLNSRIGPAVLFGIKKASKLEDGAI